MKHGRFLAGLAACLPWFVGCAQDRQRIELLEQELRWQEDEICFLQDKVAEDERRLDACRRENKSLKQELGVSDGKSYNPRKDLPSFPRGGNGGRKGSGTDLPMVDPGKEFEPGEANKPKSGDSTGVYPRMTPATARTVANEVALPSDTTITKIEINKRLTGGHNADGKPGDDGLLVVFEPRNAAGELVELPGETSIVLMDPDIDGEASRIARWDFATDEVVTHFAKTFLGKGLLFELRWPNQRPENRKLRLYVRFITPEGKRLIAEKDIKIQFPEDYRRDTWAAKEPPPEKPLPENDLKPVHMSEHEPRTAGRAATAGDSDAPQWKPFR